ncbi:MAG TPA: DUF3043 domain-containing protein [Stackebrandtia sp.]|uniref:DUF3043 domain-containing protein n=1 Tax=Stackebrandtia sp. TaxID=2023065 RepID=UPI002D449F15|nr:DUF3043 domain-containing protein [Stackebrandtia sp.]HZE41822.1 DUF3043 domain-containing protein [Stackebrandtia sp.]
MPALFKRKSSEPDVEEPVSAVEETGDKRVRDKSDPTPKRPKTAKKRPPKNPPKTFKEARAQAKVNRPDKDTRKSLSQQRREERVRIADGQDRGDPAYDQYHMPRDKGPERLLVRDIVDGRRSVGQYFFFLAIIIMLASNPAYGALIYSISVGAWVAILLAFIIDSFLLTRKVRRLVWSRHPKTKQRKPGLYWYAISRSIMFRKLRMPRPRPGIKPGILEEDLGKQIR